LAIVGPTAAGKSDLALDLAERLDGELVNADSMALYRGLDIGTARTPEALRRGVPHHQIDVLDVTEEASVAAYQRCARADIEAIWARGRRPVLVGGSGLYVRAVTDRIEFPGTDAALRAKWERMADQLGAEALHRELARRDPAAADAIGPRNARRLVRALEVVELTGGKFQASLPQPSLWRPAVTIGLTADLEWLDGRIGRRAGEMMRAGLVAETRALVARGLREGRTASRAIGYKEALAVLDGELGPDQAEELISVATRRLARRQLKWFRRDGRVRWIDAAAPGLVDSAMAAARTS
jgi:tRNA dimethylallyltransferase